MRRSEEVITAEPSPTELRVLQLLNEGKSQKTISHTIDVTKSTVSTLVYRLNEKAKRRGYRKMTVFVNSEGEIWRG